MMLPLVVGWHISSLAGAAGKPPMASGVDKCLRLADTAERDYFTF